MTKQITVAQFLHKMPAHLLRLWYAPKGLGRRRVRNIFARLNGNEPTPGRGAGFKRWARYHRRVS